MSILLSTNTNAVASAREIQLRREAIAAMRLHNAMRSRSGAWREAEHTRFHRDGGQEQPTGAGNGISARPHVEGDRQGAEGRGRILLISDYDGLRSSRAMVLRRQGYEVDAMGSGEFLAKASAGKYDLAILCQSLESDRARLIGGILRRMYPGCFVLRVEPCLRGLEQEFDLSMDGFDSPEILLSVLQRLVQSHPKSA